MVLAAVILCVVACVLGGVSFVFSEPLKGVSAGWFISLAVVFGCVAVWVLFFPPGFMPSEHGKFLSLLVGVSVAVGGVVGLVCRDAWWGVFVTGVVVLGFVLVFGFFRMVAVGGVVWGLFVPLVVLVWVGVVAPVWVVGWVVCCVRFWLVLRRGSKV